MNDPAEIELASLCWEFRRDSLKLLSYVKAYRESFGEGDPVSAYAFHVAMGSVDYPQWKQQSLAEIIKCGIIRRDIGDTKDALHVFYRLYPESNFAPLNDFKFSFLLKEYAECRELVKNQPKLLGIRLIKICLSTIEYAEGSPNALTELTGGDLRIAKELVKRLDDYLGLVEVLNIVKI
jgi:hypothetical protein